MAEAEAAEPIDPNAMALATVDAQGAAQCADDSLEGADERGFVFYTNCESAKGLELAANPKAALLFYWKSLDRQIRMRGPVEPVTEAEADAYFATRHRARAASAPGPRASRGRLRAARVLEEEVAH